MNKKNLEINLRRFGEISEISCIKQTEIHFNEKNVFDKYGFNDKDIIYLVKVKTNDEYKIKYVSHTELYSIGRKLTGLKRILKKNLIGLYIEI